MALGWRVAFQTTGGGHPPDLIGAFWRPFPFGRADWVVPVLFDLVAGGFARAQESEGFCGCSFAGKLAGTRCIGDLVKDG
ncbi:hypothetical protein C0431_01525 [bacterium]|nr:hypothetical protein [bacterium]